MIEVIFSNEPDYEVDLAALERVVARVFLVKGITVARVGVHLVDIETMTYLNENYKHHQGATDVLSFVMHDPQQPTPTFLESDDARLQYGDVFLCYPVIVDEVDSEDKDETVQSRLEFLLEHGCWHLLGVHHD